MFKREPGHTSTVELNPSQTRVGLPRSACTRRAGPWRYGFAGARCSTGQPPGTCLAGADALQPAYGVLVDRITDG